MPVIVKKYYDMSLTCLGETEWTLDWLDTSGYGREGRLPVRWFGIDCVGMACRAVLIESRLCFGLSPLFLLSQKRFLADSGQGERSRRGEGDEQAPAVEAGEAEKLEDRKAHLENQPLDYYRKESSRLEWATS